MASSLPPPGLRPYLPADGPVLADLFRESIFELTGDDYSPDQQAEWAATADDEEAFASRLAGSLTLVATIAGEPVGFATLQGADIGDTAGTPVLQPDQQQVQPGRVPGHHPAGVE